MEFGEPFFVVHPKTSLHSQFFLQKSQSRTGIFYVILNCCQLSTNVLKVVQRQIY